MKALTSAAVAVVVLVVSFIGAAAGIFSTGGNAAACVIAAGGGQQAVARLDAEQTVNAAVIVEVAGQLRLPQRAAVVAVATASQESNLRNIGYGDRDSLGLFQQRPTQGWGTPRQLLDPRYAAHAFYARLIQVPHWERLPLTAAAQAVQRSAHPDAYARHESRASRIVAALTTPSACLSAAPAPRNPDGSWPTETASGPDRITPRTRRVRDLIKRLFDVPYGIGCYRPASDIPGSDHPTGKACDFMLSSGGRMPTAAEQRRGAAIVAWAQANADRLGIRYIIYRQRIWNIERPAEGWRPMPDRGSITANHYDHPHISLY